MKLTDEQTRLLYILQKGNGSIAKYAAPQMFHSRTIASLLNKGLIRDDYSMGYYTITEEGITISS